MIKNDLILKNPLGFLGPKGDDILPEGGLGAVLARAGVGKTAFLVQLAINHLLRNQNVLHVALKDPVRKVVLSYEEVYRNMTSLYHSEGAENVWEAILPNRFIMTFQVEGFSVPKLDERMLDLTEQGIFTPGIVLMDGLPFDSAPRDILAELKTLCEKKGLRAWLTVTTHRHEPNAPDGYPSVFSPVADMFDSAIQLLPEEKGILVNPIKGPVMAPESPAPLLNPSTMIVS